MVTVFWIFPGHFKVFPSVRFLVNSHFPYSRGSLNGMIRCKSLNFGPNFAQRTHVADAVWLRSQSSDDPINLEHFFHFPHCHKVKTSSQGLDLIHGRECYLAVCICSLEVKIVVWRRVWLVSHLVLATISRVRLFGLQQWNLNKTRSREKRLFVAAVPRRFAVLHLALE